MCSCLFALLLDLGLGRDVGENEVCHEAVVLRGGEDLILVQGLIDLDKLPSGQSSTLGEGFRG